MNGGFRPARLPLKLDFSGTEYEGLEVTVRPVPMAVMLDVAVISAWTEALPGAAQ